MANSLHVIQILIAVFLIGAVLLQVRGEGSGMFGAAESSGLRVRRGLDKLLFQATIVLIILFLGVALLTARFT